MPAGASIPSHFRGLCSPQRRPRQDRFCSIQTPYDSSHRADDPLGVLATHAGTSTTHTTAHAAPPAVTKPREDDAPPPKACPQAPLLHDTHAVRFLTKLGREDRVRVLVCTGDSRANHAPGFFATYITLIWRAPRLFPTSIFTVHLRSSVLGRHETRPHSLLPLAFATPNKSLASAADDSARDDNELTVTADDDHVGGSINPPSLRVNYELPSPRVSYEALPPLRVHSNAGRHDVERKPMPVLFIRI
ncbi:hypothetical protein K438DRAFT_1974600 [Mycena galopus ATCC 62051]|nr:hypothetical protein K438DRAFT_1974600 [Mycena galopus ATCC 62051]